MQILAPISGNKIELGGATFLRLDNGAHWIETEYDPDDMRTYYYEVSDQEYLEQVYRETLEK